MKRIIFGLSLVFLFTPAFAAVYINPAKNNAVQPARSSVYTSPEPAGNDSYRQTKFHGEYVGQWYMGARFAMNFAGFNNEYSDSDLINGSDSYPFSMQLGVDTSVGYQFASQWRAELNYGYTGRFEDKDSVATFWLSSQYLALNAIYTAWKDSKSRLYAGFGAGAAALSTHMSGSVFIPDAKETRDHYGAMGQVMVGVEHDITQNIALNLQYRLMLQGGATHKSEDIYDNTFETKIGSIITNSAMIGLRLRF